MNKKYLIAAVVLGSVAALSVLSKKVDRPATNATVGKMVSDGVDFAKVDFVSIKKASESIDFSSGESKNWTMNKDDNFPIQGNKLAEVFDKLSQMKVLRVVTSDPKAALKTKLGLDQPTQLTLKSGKETVLDLSLGNSRDKGGQYVSLAGKKDIFLISQSYTPSTNAEAWELKELLSLKLDDVDRVGFSPAPTTVSEVATLNLMRNAETKELVLEELEEGKVTNLTSFEQKFKRLFGPMKYSKKLSADNVLALTAIEKASEFEIGLVGGGILKVLVGEAEEVSPAQKEGEAETKSKKYFAKVLVENSEQFSEAWKPKIIFLQKLMQEYSFELSSYEGANYKLEKASLMQGKPKTEAKSDEKANDLDASGSDKG